MLVGTVKDEVDMQGDLLALIAMAAAAPAAVACLPSLRSLCLDFIRTRLKGETGVAP